MYAFSEEPVAGIDSTRKIGDIRSNSGTLSFTAADNESYVILKYRSTNTTTYPMNVPSEVVKTPETVVKYMGIEQIDNGTDYKNEKFGYVYKLNSEQIIDAVVESGIVPAEEVADIRTGADGTVYSSAGDAVRTQVGKLNDMSDDITNNQKTSQLLDRGQTCGHIYVKSDLSVITSNIVDTWIVPVTPGKRYVVYFIENEECSLKENSTSGGQSISIYTFNASPAVESTALRKLTDINMAGKEQAFTAVSSQTAGASENYILIVYRSTDNTLYPLNDPKTVVKYLGAEQIDSGIAYQNERYGYKYYLKTDKVVDAVEQSGILKGTHWKDKKIWWCGTSIPEGRDTAIGSPSNGKSYPEIVGELLDADVINVSLGSSMARANTCTGDYNDAYSYNIVRAMSATVEEKTDMIQNWSTYRTRLRDPDTYTDLSSLQTTILNSSFENLLLPYLDGTNEMPDVFVFDHGHNDHKYKLANNETDIMLTPDVQNISGGVLAEDTYMTANNNEKLESFFGDFSGIPSAEFDAFIASVNRNCYIGAMNFLCTLILHYNPRAKIIFIGNLDSWQRTGLTDAQEYLANSWEFPIIKIWEQTGFSNHIIPGTAHFWNSENTTDLTMKKIYCKDGTHPHSDTTGTSIQMYANVIVNALKTLWR